MNKKNIILCLGIAIFGIVGIYSTFISGNTNKYDSKTRAYKIYTNETYDSDDNTIYYPIYYFKVEGKDYECKAKNGSSSYPNEKKNMVYYDSSNPSKCLTEYEKSASKFVGIICLVVTVILIYFGVIKKPSTPEEDSNQVDEDNLDISNVINQKNVEKATRIIAKAQLIYKRVILGIIIIVLLLLTLIETLVLKQTIIAKDYPETIAEYVTKENENENDAFYECIYTFTDIYEKEHEIIVSIPREIEPKAEIRIKYNKNNPQDYYKEGAFLSEKGIIWYVVKIVVIILLTILFFNKELLSKINISTNKSHMLPY